MTSEEKSPKRDCQKADKIVLKSIAMIFKNLTAVISGKTRAKNRAHKKR